MWDSDVVTTSLSDAGKTHGVYGQAMYLRHTTRHKDGTVHTYGKLMRSGRIGRRVVQQTVAQLGELDAQGRARAKRLVQALVGRVPQRDLVASNATAPTGGPVHLDRRRLEQSRRFGDVWLGLTPWCAVRLNTVVSQRLPEGREAVPWATIAASVVLARLWEPSSEVHLAETRYR